MLGIIGVLLCSSQVLASMSPFGGPKTVPVRVLTPFRRPAELSSSEEASDPELDPNNSDDEEEIVHSPFSRRPGAFGIAGRVAGGLDSWADFESALPESPPKIAKNSAVYRAQVEERFRAIQATPLGSSDPQIILQTPSPDEWEIGLDMDEHVELRAPAFIGPGRDVSDSPEMFDVAPVFTAETMTNPFMSRPFVGGGFSLPGIQEESQHDSTSSVSDEEEEEERVFNPKASKRSRLITFVGAESNTFPTLASGLLHPPPSASQSGSDASGGNLRNNKKRAAKEAFDH